MTNGYYARRRGILEHLEEGRIGLLELGLHDLLCLRAQWRVGGDSRIPPGILFTSAPAICALSRDLSEKSVQRGLSVLEEIGFIRRWITPGKRGNYPVLVDRFIVRDASGNEYLTNARKTSDWGSPVLEPCRGSVDDPGSDPGSDAESDPGSDLSGILRKKKEESRTKTPSVNGTHKQCYEYAYEDFKFRRSGVTPTWDGSDAKALQGLLKKGVTFERFKAAWDRFGNSTVQFDIEQGLRLRCFCSLFHKYDNKAAPGEQAWTPQFAGERNPSTYAGRYSDKGTNDV